MTSAHSASIDVEVRYAETDAMGIVHHSNYLVWFELARTRLCHQGTGRHYAEIERSGYRLTVTGAAVRYRQPARYGDTVRVEAWIDRLASRAIRFAYRIDRGSDRLGGGHTDHVWIDEAGRPCRIPAELEPIFRQLAIPDERP